MSERIVLIGAGSAQFGLGMVGDVLRCEELSGCTVVLHDVDPDSLAYVADVSRKYVDSHGLSQKIVATTDRKEALAGATFCIISIEVGDRFSLWEQDWMVPLQFGIRQVYGENGGPGGLFHALRIIPPIIAICADIQALCPDAVVFNFSNPMSRICTTVTRRFPDLRFVGLCHEINALFLHLPRMLEVPLSNLAFRAGGLNHFSVLLEVTYRDSGRDAYPDVRRLAPEYFADLSSLAQTNGMAAEPDAPNPPMLQPRSGGYAELYLLREMLRRFDYLPITSDSHFGEYIQWAHEVVDHRGIRDFYSWYKEYCQSRKTAAIRTDAYKERAVPIMAALLADSGEEEAAVNIPNRGPLIKDLPEFIAVEVPALLLRNGVEGVPLGALPRGIWGLLNNQVAVHDLTAEAALTGSRKAALQALLVDPVVDSVHAAEQTLDTLIEIQKPYLDYLH